MLIDNGDSILKNLSRSVAVFLSVFVAVPVSVFVERKLLLVIAELVEQALAQIAATYARRVELADRVQSFLQIGGGEFGCPGRGRWRLRGFGSGSDGCSRVPGAHGKRRGRIRAGGAGFCSG